MPKLIETMLNTLPSISDIDINNLHLKNPLNDIFYDTKVVYNNKLLIAKSYLIPSSFRGVDLETSDHISEIENTITKLSTYKFNKQRVLDFNINCPIYDSNFEVSHLPTDCLEYFITNSNNKVLITPTLYPIMRDDDETCEEDEKQCEWKWEVYAVVLIE